MTRHTPEEILKQKEDIKTYMKPKRKNFSAYIPPDMLKALKEDAEANMRSASGHLVYILGEHLKKAGRLKKS